MKSGIFPSLRAALCFSLFMVLAEPVLPAQERDFVLPSGEELEEIFNKAVIIKTTVSRELEENKTKWIEMYTDIHTSTAVSFSGLRETVMEFEKYPDVFKRNVSTVFFRNENLLEMVTGLEVMGVSFYTRYRVLVTEVVNTPGKLVLDFSHAADDGRVRNVRGRWHLERYFQSETGEERCYVRYFAASGVMQKVPLQRMIMSMFINGETRDLLNQFLDAAGRPETGHGTLRGSQRITGRLKSAPTNNNFEIGLNKIKEELTP